MNTLCWSLTKSKSDTTDFGEYVYDMYYLSMAMAKNCGYRTVLYGNSNAIERLKSICDEIINIDFLDYQFYDDPKVYIWATRQGEYATIDGDVFIYERLNFDNNSFTSKKIDLIVEEFQPLSGASNLTEPVPKAWRLFNLQNPSSCIFEWEFYENVDSYNTGLIHWKNNEFKKYFVQSYYNLRRWYIYNKPYFDEHDITLRTNLSVSSHFICEHLMRRISYYYKLNVKALQNDTEQKYKYTHLVGTDKFTNPDHYLGIKILVDEIKYLKSMGLHGHKLNIEKIYIELSKLYGAL
jgi:hypothetical protein